MIQDRECRECKNKFKGGPRAFYCPVCRHERRKQAKAAYQKRKAAGDHRPIGSVDKCERCGKEYTVEGSLQRFCPECQPIHTLEYDRETTLPFYHENKGRINPVRNIKRRKRGNICAWCEKEFEPVNGSTTCSEECRRLDHNRYQRERGKRIRSEHARPVGSYTISEIALEIGKNKTTVLNWYNTGKMPEPDGYEKRGNPFWLYETIKNLIETKRKKDPASI